MIRAVRETLLVAVLLTIGLVTWWELVPGPVSAEKSSGSALIVTALLTLPLAILAVAGSSWLLRRQRRASWWLDDSHRTGRTRGSLLLHAGLIAAAFTMLALVTAPIQQTVYSAVTSAGEPNLAAVHFDDSCPASTAAASILAAECQRLKEDLGGANAAKLASLHGAMVEHAQHVDAGQALTGQRGSGGIAAWQALAIGGIALLLAMLGLYLARILPSSLPMTGLRGRVRGRVRTRWAAVGGTLTLLATGSLVFVPGTQALAVPPPFSVPLRIPPVLTGSQVSLTMAETDVQLLPSGPPTRMWTYNGSFPGPTIRRPSGQTTEVTVHNQLPLAAGSMTVHHHGNHSRSSQDGQPTKGLIPTGGSLTYTYEHMEDGVPERAATQWYHDHRMDVTGRNVWNGLAGMYILDDAVEDALPLPKGEFDVPLMIVDRTFDADNQIPYRFFEGGVLGNTILVNGAPQPYYEVGDRMYRFRVLNASNLRPYFLALSNGQPMIQIGTESGLLPEPIARSQIQLFPGERAEIVVDFAGHLGEQIVLQNVGDSGIGTSQIMQFRVTRDLTETSIVPSMLRPAPTFPTPVVTRNWTLNLDMSTRTWLINGLPFDPNRVDATPVLGTTERWTFTNLTIFPHVIHIHDVDWQLVARNGAPPPAWETGLKESWVVPPFEDITVVTTFTDHVGRFVFHCHMLEHEDRAMMAQFQVRAA